MLGPPPPSMGVVLPFAPLTPVVAPAPSPFLGDARLVNHAPTEWETNSCGCSGPAACNPAMEPVFSKPPRRTVPVSKVYLVVNPYGGKGKGTMILKAALEEFRKHGCDVAVLTTTHRRHAEEYANSVPLAGFDAICAIGGDGTFNEVVNGLLTRQDRQRLPLGFIAGIRATHCHTMSRCWLIDEIDEK